MAIYTWNFKVNQNHTLHVDHPFKGNIVIRLDNKKIHESETQELTFDFRVEERLFELKIIFENQNYGIAQVQTWAHYLFMYHDGNWETIQSS
jgi:hypothetical protein